MDGFPLFRAQYYLQPGPAAHSREFWYRVRRHGVAHCLHSGRHADHSPEEQEAAGLRAGGKHAWGIYVCLYGPGQYDVSVSG